MAASDDRGHLQKLFRDIHAVIRRIPRGRVATYGQVAEVAGIPNGGRIGAAALKQGAKVPWWRVLGKAGKTRARIAILDPIGAAMQRELLAKEGVAVERGFVDLGAHGWLVPRTGVRPTASRGRAASPRRRPRSASTRRASSSRR